MSRIEDLGQKLHLLSAAQQDKAQMEKLGARPKVAGHEGAARELFLIWREQVQDLFGLARYEGSGPLTLPALAAEALFVQASMEWGETPPAIRKGDYDNADRVMRAAAEAALRGE